MTLRVLLNVIWLTVVCHIYSGKKYTRCFILCKPYVLQQCGGQWINDDFTVN